MSNRFDPDQARHFVGPDLAKVISRLQMSPLAGKKLNAEQLIDTLYYLLAKTLAKVNFIWHQLFPFG